MATQLPTSEAATASERRKVLAEWIRFLSGSATNITDLALVSRVPQELLDSVAGQSKLTSLRVNWGPYHDLSPLVQIPGLQHLDFNGAGSVRSLTPLRSLPKLSQLWFSQAHRVDDVTVLSDLTSLKELLFGNDYPGSDKSVVLHDLRWVRTLSKLTTLKLPGTRLINHDLTDLLELPKLASLTLPLRRDYRKQVFELAQRSTVFAHVSAEYEEYEAWRANPMG